MLVTGHTGFKGAWLACWLQQLGAQVTGLALDPPSDPSLWSLLALRDVDDRRADVRDRDAIAAIVRTLDPEVIFHLAAQSLVRKAHQKPAETFETNLMGTVNVLDAARLAPHLKAVVIATTDKCYENDECRRSFRENDRLGGPEPYSASKACAELAVAAYRNSYFKSPTRVATIRAGNVIGGGDWGQERLFADVARTVLDRTPLRIRHPQAVRPWQHVLDALAAYLQVAQALIAGTPQADRGWNVGPAVGQEHSVEWVLHQFLQIWPGAFEYVPAHVTGPYEAQHLALDSSAIGSAIGWKPKLDTHAAVAWTAEWMRDFRDGQSASHLCAAQIAAWTELGNTK